MQRTLCSWTSHHKDTQDSFRCTVEDWLFLNIVLHVETNIQVGFSPSFEKME